MKTIDAKTIDSLKRGFRGEVVLPGSGAYDEARSIWNGMIDKRPAVIARCVSPDDVVQAVKFARDQRLVLAVRGGGHNIAGNALCDDGLVIDLSRMKGVTVEASARRATVEAGATLADVDAATQKHGLAVPVGINSTTGIAGLTLGGGFGWTSRKFGLTIDALESAELITADGKVVRASASENPDLFWAIRGGGGNFGVVTRFEFRLQPLGPEVLSGLIVYPIDAAKKVLHQYREFMAKAPDELTVWTLLRLAPPLPFLPAEVHGKGILALPFLYAGDPKAGEGLIEPLRRFGTPYGEHVGVMPFTGWQQMFDPLLVAGARNYWKTHNFLALPDGAIDVAIDFSHRLPSPHCEVFFAALGGVVWRPPADGTAYVGRDARFVMNVHGRWDNPADDARCIGWARDLYKAMAPFASAGAYVNFMTADEGERIRAAYGANYDRLAKVKRAYDPDNLFSVNQNIRPAA
jgi:FAD/FMN-containing dehydrogenase